MFWVAVVVTAIGLLMIKQMGLIGKLIGGVLTVGGIVYLSSYFFEPGGAMAITVFAFTLMAVGGMMVQTKARALGSVVFLAGLFMFAAVTGVSEFLDRNSDEISSRITPTVTGGADEAENTAERIDQNLDTGG